MLICYIQLNQIGLSKNILRALLASRTDMPELEMFPKAHIVTFKYYVGVISFLEENYKQVILTSPTISSQTSTDTFQAEANLTEAYSLCLTSAHRNKE